MTETQEQFFAEGKSLGKKRRAGSSRWGGVWFKQSFSYLTPRAVVLGSWGTAPSVRSCLKRITVREGTGLQWKREAAGQELWGVRGSTTGLKNLETESMWGKSSRWLWGTDLELGKVMGAVKDLV